MGAAQRMAKMRARQGAGRMIVPVVVDEVAIVEALRIDGFLRGDPMREPTRDEIAAAMESMLKIYIEAVARDA